MITPTILNALSVLDRLRQAGTAVLLVEQLTVKAAALADRVCGLARGRIVLDAPGNTPDIHERLERAYMGQSA